MSINLLLALPQQRKLSSMQLHFQNKIAIFAFSLCLNIPL